MMKRRMGCFLMKHDINVTHRIAWSVCLQSVTVVSSAKTAKPIEMPFGSSRVDPRNHDGRSAYHGI